jgi:hypothetical protein
MFQRLSDQSQKAPARQQAHSKHLSVPRRYHYVIRHVHAEQIRRALAHPDNLAKRRRQEALDAEMRRRTLRLIAHYDRLKERRYARAGLPVPTEGEGG